MPIVLQQALEIVRRIEKESLKINANQMSTHTHNGTKLETFFCDPYAALTKSYKFR